MARQPKIWFRGSNRTYYTTINGKQISLGKNKVKAQSKFDALVETQKNGSIERVDVLFNEFLEDVEQTRSEGTYNSYRDFVKSFNHTIPNLLVVDLKPDHVRRWLNGQKTWNQTTKSIAIRTIKRAFSWAVEQGLIKLSPLAILKAPRTYARDTTISPEDWKTLLTEVHTQELKDMLTALRETGCRPFEARQVTAKHYRNGCWVFPAKTSKGKKYSRVVYLNDTAKEITERLIKKNPSGPIFRNPIKNRPWTQDALEARLRKLTEKTGIRVFAYAFRHTFCTEGLENGVDSVVMAQFLGHQSLDMISRHYSHIARNKSFLLEQLKRARPSGEDVA